MSLITLARMRKPVRWRNECCGVLMRGQCADCPLTVPMRPQSRNYFVTDFNEPRCHPTDEEHHDMPYFLRRVDLGIRIAMVALAVLVAWMLVG